MRFYLGKWLVLSLIFCVVCSCSSKETHEDAHPITQKSASGIDKESIRLTIREHIRDIRMCYEHELKNNEISNGKVVIGWRIVSDGSTTNARVVSSTLPNANVGECIAKMIARMKFAPLPPTGPKMVEVLAYPFVFSEELSFTE